MKKEKYPVLRIAFWKPSEDKIGKLRKDDLILFTPATFSETVAKLFATDS
jgi:hypothetical protein